VIIKNSGISVELQPGEKYWKNSKSLFDIIGGRRTVLEEKIPMTVNLEGKNGET